MVDGSNDDFIIPEGLPQNANSIITCITCKNEHHASICGKFSEINSEPMLATTKVTVTYPVTITKINGVNYRVLLDKYSGNFNGSESLTDLLKVYSVEKEEKIIKALK